MDITIYIVKKSRDGFIWPPLASISLIALENSSCSGNCSTLVLVASPPLELLLLASASPIIIFQNRLLR